MDKIYFKFSWTNGSVTEDYIENWVIQVVDKDDKIYHEFYEYDIRNNEILTVEFSIPLVRAELYARFYINEPKPDNLMGERKLDMNFGTDRKFIRRKGEISTFSYEPKNCKTQLEYTQCTPVCGPNRSRYMLDVLKQSSDNGGIECPYDPDIYPRTVEGSTQSCESTVCPDCEAGFVRTCADTCNEKGESVETNVYKIQKYPGEGGKACLHYNGYTKYGVCGEKACDSKYELFSGTDYTGDRVTLGIFDTAHNLPFYPRSAKFLGSYSGNVFIRFRGSGDFEGIYIDADFSSDLSSVWFPQSPKTVEIIKGNAPQYSDDEIWFASSLRGRSRATWNGGYSATIVRYWFWRYYDYSWGGSVLTSSSEEHTIYTSSGSYNFIKTSDLGQSENIRINSKYGTVYAVKSNGRSIIPDVLYSEVKDYHSLILLG